MDKNNENLVNPQTGQPETAEERATREQQEQAQREAQTENK